MTKLKSWLINKFLPVYVSIAEREERERLRGLVRDRDAEIAQLQAYIKGMNRGYRNARRCKGVED